MRIVISKTGPIRFDVLQEVFNAKIITDYHLDDLTLHLRFNKKNHSNITDTLALCLFRWSALCLDGYDSRVGRGLQYDYVSDLTYLSLYDEFEDE